MSMNYSEKQKRIFNSVRNSLTELLSAASQINISTDQIHPIKETLKALEDKFLIVVVGEFNAGKSSFVNVLLNTELLEEGVTPTTANIQLIRYGENTQVSLIEDWGVSIQMPSPLLDSISFVDTPGTNTIIAEHEILTNWFLPKADLVIFLSSADRPYSESENKFLLNIKEWGKKIIIVLNKIDLIQTQQEIERVINFVKENADKQLKCDVPVFAVSSKIAKQARKEASEGLWNQSGFSLLEKYIQEKLDESVRFQLKMDSSLRIGERLAKQCLNLLAGELMFYQEDQELANSIQSQVQIYQKDMQNEIDRSIKEIDSIFFEIEKQGAIYFENLFRAKNIPNIMKKEKNQIAFQEQVLKNLPTEIERKTTDIVEMIYTQQQQMTQSFRKQIETRKTQFPGTEISTREQIERSSLLQKMQASIDEMLEKMEHDMAANIGMKHIQTAVTTALAIEVSAIGVGAALTIIATTVAADILSIVAAFWIGIAGFLVLPYYRKKSQKEFENQMTEIKLRLTDSLTKEFRLEIDSQVDHLNQAIQPFQRFIQSAMNRVQAQIQQITAIMNQISEIDKDL
jgi:small GTP-binding protein